MKRFGGLTKPALLTVFAVFLLAANLFLVNHSFPTALACGDSCGVSHKILICHVPPGNPGNAHAIEVDRSAWEHGHDPHNTHDMDFAVDGDHPCPPVVPSPTPTPTPEPGCHDRDCHHDCDEHEDHDCHHPTPSPTPTETPCPTETPAPTPQPESTPTPTPTSTPGGSAPQPCNGCGDWPSAPSCGATVPAAPILLSVDRHGTTATLTWTAVNPVTHYTISYGLSPDNYIYGVPSTGNVTSFTVGELDPNTTYYWSVRAVNDCAPSGPSTGIGGGQVLGASTLASTGSLGLIYLTLSAALTFLTFSFVSARHAVRKV